MELKNICNTFYFVLCAASLRVLADSDEGGSCEDSDDLDFYTPCQQYLYFARCRNYPGPICGSNRITYWGEYTLAHAACPRGRWRPAFYKVHYGFCRRVITMPPELIPIRPGHRPTISHQPTRWPHPTRAPLRTRPPKPTRPRPVPPKLIPTKETGPPQQTRPPKTTRPRPLTISPSTTPSPTPSEPCSFRCPWTNPLPFVCGTDGTVYPSRCHLRRYNCINNLRVAVTKMGVCIKGYSNGTTTPAPPTTTMTTTTATPATPAVTTRSPSTATTTTQQPTTVVRQTPVVTTWPAVPPTAAQATTIPVIRTTIPPTTTTTITPSRRTPNRFGGENTPQPGRGDTPCNDNCPDGPPDGSAAVCGSDGETYETECHLLVRQCQADRSLTTVSRGACRRMQKQCAPTSICPKEYLPICGTGNITYPSLCHFQIAACHARDDTRKVLFAGECPQKPAVSGHECGTCSTDISLVCGTDNSTYSSECALNEIACRKNKPELTVLYTGSCENQACPDTCADIVDPVCATNGQTYISLCALSVAACKTSRTEITVAYRGRCDGDFCNVQCPDIYEPLCDNKGKTYQNACQLWVAICKDPTLSEKLTQEGCNLAIP